jgi:hypothetical protein
MDKEDQMDWTLYTDNGMPSKSSETRLSNTRSAFRGICELSKIVYNSLYVLYPPRRALTCQDVMGIYSQYLNWYDTMLEVLKSGDNSTPTALFTQ